MAAIEKKKRLGAGKYRQRDKAIVALITSTSVVEASRNSGIAYSSLIRWMSEPDFKAQLEAVKHQYLTAATNELQMSAVAAVRALRAVLEAPHSSNMERIAASRSLLEFCDRFSTAENLNERITALEKQTGKAIRYGEPQSIDAESWESGTPASSGWSASFATDNANGGSDGIESAPVDVRRPRCDKPNFTRGWNSADGNKVQATQAQNDAPVALPVLVK